MGGPAGRRGGRRRGRGGLRLAGACRPSGRPGRAGRHRGRHAGHRRAARGRARRHRRRLRRRHHARATAWRSCATAGSAPMVRWRLPSRSCSGRARWPRSPPPGWCCWRSLPRMPPLAACCRPSCAVCRPPAATACRPASAPSPPPRRGSPWGSARSPWSLALGIPGALAAAIALGIAFWWLRRACLARIGGQTGDVLGALEQVAESAVACRRLSRFHLTERPSHDPLRGFRRTARRLPGPADGRCCRGGGRPAAPGWPDQAPGQPRPARGPGRLAGPLARSRDAASSIASPSWSSPARTASRARRLGLPGRGDGADGGQFRGRRRGHQPAGACRRRPAQGRAAGDRRADG